MITAVSNLVGKYKQVILAILVVALLAAVFATGWKTAKYSCLQEKLEAMNALIDEQNSLQDENAKIETEYYEDREERRIKYRELYKEAGKLVKAGHDISSCDIGPNGLQLWNAANQGRAPGKSKTAVP